MAAANGDQASSGVDESAVKPPPNVIIPPKNVRDNVTKTADFVFRRGEQQELLLQSRVRDKPNSAMSFVLPADTYHPYYLWYLQQLREGNGPSAAKARAIQDNKPQGPLEPPKFRFSARMPNISAKDLEVLKLTALYAARVGENWLQELRNRESGNSQFEFLRANHSFQGFFRSLIDQYRSLMEEEQTVQARIQELQHNIRDRFHVLARAKQRAAYVKHVSQQKEKEEKKVEDERREYASIDWHDFTTIATVLFDEGDDAADLAPPANLSDLQSASLEQKAAMSLHAKRIEEALPDEATYYNSSHQPVMPPPGYPAMPSMAPPIQPAPVDYRLAAQKQEEEEARSRQTERDHVAQAQAAARGVPSSMRIRTGYVPRGGKKTNVASVQCPNCKQSFPSDEIEEHIRIELLDPRWKEQRAKTDARYSTVITPSEAANNLKRFASQRSDIYDGVAGESVSKEEAARRKRVAMSYDGQPDPAKDAVRLQQMQSMNVQEQLRRIQERHGSGQ